MKFKLDTCLNNLDRITERDQFLVWRFPVYFGWADDPEEEKNMMHAWIACLNIDNFMRFM